MRNTYYTTPALSEALTPQDPPSETLRMPPPPYRMVVTVSADEGSDHQSWWKRTKDRAKRARGVSGDNPSGKPPVQFHGFHLLVTLFSYSVRTLHRLIRG